MDTLERVFRNSLSLSAVDDDKKRDAGQVFTPLKLVDHMLDGLPQSVWKNPDLKWLDPAAGHGVFAAVAHRRLMASLRAEIPDDATRSRHIIRNMLYSVEYDPETVISFKRVFKAIDASVEPNIATADFVEWSKHTDRLESYDVVMGNPPYNLAGLNKGGAFWMPFWAVFVLRSIDLLKKGGYLVMVHPPGWRKPAGVTVSAGDVLARFQKDGGLLRLAVDDRRKPPFPQVDHYIWKKGRRSKRTAVQCWFGGEEHNPSTQDLSQLPFVPSLITPTSMSIVWKLLSKPGNSRFAFIRDNRFRFTKNQASTSANSVPHIHYFNGETLGLDEEQMKAMKDTSHYEKPKIVVTFNAPKKPGRLYPEFFDGSKAIGVTTNVAYEIIDPKRAPAFLSFLSSRLVRFLMLITQYSAAPNRKNEIKVINAIPRPAFKTPKTDQQIYTHYGLSTEERALVESVVSSVPS